MRILEELMKHFIPAMEADDITGATQRATQDALGRTGGSSLSKANDAGGNVKEDLSATDIIGYDGGESEASDETPSDTQDESDSNTDLSDDSNLEDDDSDNQSEDAEEDNSTEPQKDPEEKSPFDKNRLKNSIILFINILDGNITLLRDCMTNMTDSTSVAIYNEVLTNFTDCKNTLYNLVTDSDFGDKPYEEVLQTYVAISRVHEIGIKMLKLYAESKDSKIKNLKSLVKSK